MFTVQWGCWLLTPLEWVAGLGMGTSTARGARFPVPNGSYPAEREPARSSPIHPLARLSVSERLRRSAAKILLALLYIWGWQCSLDFQEQDGRDGGTNFRENIADLWVSCKMGKMTSRLECCSSSTLGSRANDYVKTLATLGFWLHHTPCSLGAGQTTPSHHFALGRHQPLSGVRLYASMRSPVLRPAVCPSWTTTVPL